MGDTWVFRRPYKWPHRRRFHTPAVFSTPQTGLPTPSHARFAINAGYTWRKPWRWPHRRKYGIAPAGSGPPPVTTTYSGHRHTIFFKREVFRSNWHPARARSFPMGPPKPPPPGNLPVRRLHYAALLRMYWRPKIPIHLRRKAVTSSSVTASRWTWSIYAKPVYRRLRRQRLSIVPVNPPVVVVAGHQAWNWTTQGPLIDARADVSAAHVPWNWTARGVILVAPVGIVAGDAQWAWQGKGPIVNPSPVTIPAGHTTWHWQMRGPVITIVTHWVPSNPTGGIWTPVAPSHNPWIPVPPHSNPWTKK